MSQNRQETKDRMWAEHDYWINLKAELEIRSLHEKLDHLLLNQWQRLLEIQGIQMELMEELTHKKAKTDWGSVFFNCRSLNWDKFWGERPNASRDIQHISKFADCASL